MIGRSHCKSKVLFFFVTIWIFETKKNEHEFQLWENLLIFFWDSCHYNSIWSIEKKTISSKKICQEFFLDSGVLDRSALLPSVSASIILHGASEKWLHL